MLLNWKFLNVAEHWTETYCDGEKWTNGREGNGHAVIISPQIPGTACRATDSWLGDPEFAQLPSRHTEELACSNPCSLHGPSLPQPGRSGLLLEQSKVRVRMPVHPHAWCQWVSGGNVCPHRQGAQCVPPYCPSILYATAFEIRPHSLLVFKSGSQ